MLLLERFAALLRSGSGRQNLIAAPTIPKLWIRHIVDSAQLLLHVGEARSWIDLGSGAGLPGLVLAILGEIPVSLNEERPLRAAFLRDAVEHLSIGSRVTVLQGKAQRLEGTFHHLSARAVAPLDQLFAIGSHLAADDATWILPKGRRAQAELAEARLSWHGMFDAVPSVTDPDATIIVARHVRRKGPG